MCGPTARTDAERRSAHHSTSHRAHARQRPLARGRRRNQLGTVPEYLGSLASLQQLLLYDCGLTELPPSLGRLGCLQKLELGDNRLARLPDSFAELRSLRELGLFHNQMTNLPRWLAHLSELFVLSADSNPWQVHFAYACRMLT